MLSISGVPTRPGGSAIHRGDFGLIVRTENPKRRAPPDCAGQALESHVRSICERWNYDGRRKKEETQEEQR